MTAAAEACAPRWFHKIANVLAALPKSAHPGATKALAEIWNAEDKRHALDAIKDFDATYGAKFPKAVAAKITNDADVLLTLFNNGKLLERPQHHPQPTAA